MKRKPANLYWLSMPSPEEDCFVIARNSRSAAVFEEQETGFESGDVRAELDTAPPVA